MVRGRGSQKCASRLPRSRRGSALRHNNTAIRPNVNRLTALLLPKFRSINFHMDSNVRCEGTHSFAALELARVNPIKLAYDTSTGWQRPAPLTE